MERSQKHFRCVLRYFFDMKKSAAEAHRNICNTYGEDAPSIKTCEYWFRRFKSGDFDIEDKERSGQPKKFEDNELLAILDEKSPQTLRELAEILNVSQAAVSKRLHALGMIQKEGKWVPKELN